MKQGSILFAVLAVVAFVGAARAQHAHVHGNAELQVTVEGPALTLLLISPLENLLGFEHAPRNDKQKAAVQSMAERLAKPDLLFVPSVDARCTAGASVINAPVLGMGGAASVGQDGKPAAPARPVPSTHRHEAGKKESPRGDGHAEINAQFTFRCEQVAALKGIEVRLFDAFRGLRRIDAQVAGAKGQKSIRLTSSRRVVSW